jgi:hypothetical protein
VTRLRRGRIAENEAFSRAVNEQALARRDRMPFARLIGERARFVCEGADDECLESIEMTLDECRHVRADPARFLVVPEHDVGSLERVVERRAAYWIVEKPERDPRPAAG